MTQTGELAVPYDAPRSDDMEVARPSQVVTRVQPLDLSRFIGENLVRDDPPGDEELCEDRDPGRDGRSGRGAGRSQARAIRFHQRSQRRLSSNTSAGIDRDREVEAAWRSAMV